MLYWLNTNHFKETNMKQKSVSGDKQVVYAIRRLKNGVGSVAIATSLALLTAFAGPVSADEVDSIPAPASRSGGSPVKWSKHFFIRCETSCEHWDKWNSKSGGRKCHCAWKCKRPHWRGGFSSVWEDRGADSWSDYPDSCEKATRRKQRKLRDSGPGMMLKNHRKTGRQGAQSFKDAKTDDYGYYLDVKLKMIRLRRLASSSTMLKGQYYRDKSIELLSPKMNEAWLDDKFKVYSYQPQAEGTVRVNYYRTDGNYDKNLSGIGEM